MFESGLFSAFALGSFKLQSLFLCSLFVRINAEKGQISVENGKINTEKVQISIEKAAAMKAAALY